MKRIISAICFVLSSSLIFAQWDYLGVQGINVQMIENNIGYKFVNTPGPTPATGITYNISSTLNDWQNIDIVNTGGGGDYGCCAIANLYFMNNSIGLRSKTYQGILNFQITTDNGNSWDSFASNISFQAKDMLLVNDSIGYISGNSYGTNHGQLYKLTSTSSVQLFDWDTLFFVNDNIEFTNQNTGFIIMNDTNQNSYLFKTTNYGYNWNQLFSSTINNFKSMSFPDSLTGYIGSTNGKIYKTIDGGTNWWEIVSPTTNNINSVDFINDSVGYIACDAGEIYRTIDGALSWNNESSGTISNLIDIQMVDIQTAYCIDEEGILLKNSNVLSVKLLSDNYISPVIIYPNPSSEFISISLPNNLNINNIEFYDNNGKHVLTGDHNRVDISSLDSGIYLIKVISGEKVFTSKLIKQ